jgi:sulfur-oxidizing protein SoxX
MKNASRQLLSHSISGTLLVILASGPVVSAATGNSAAIEAGEQIALDRKKGNCLSCHTMDNGISPGSIGPTLVSMRARFPNEEQLKRQIWDARINNPHTIMPPFGKHRILTETEIDQLVEYLYTL